MAVDREGHRVEKEVEEVGSIEKETVGILNVRGKDMIVSERNGGDIETDHWSKIADDHALDGVGAHREDRDL